MEHIFARACERRWMLYHLDKARADTAPTFDSKTRENPQEEALYWPKPSFKELKELRVENNIGNAIYRSIILLLVLPEMIVRAFWTVLFETTEDEYEAS